MAKIKIKRGLEENLPTLEVGELALTTDSEKVLVGTASGNKELGGGGGIVINEWQELKDLRDSSALVPGCQYRITDYVTTTVQENTQSAGHQFDIIVTADDVDKLNENARAVQHEGDTYFANSKLEAWKLKYCLDNDTSRFAWADGVNGKGVIYQMIDEWNNDVPYDFKNIQFKRKLTDGVLDLDSGIDTWVYTFTMSDLIEGKVVDISLKQNTEYPDDEGQYRECANNSVKEAVLDYQPDGLIRIQLNDNVFLNIFDDNSDYNYYGCYSNTFDYGCRNNTFGNSCYSNTFGDGCSSNTFGDFCYYNTFGNDCYSNTFGNDCSSNTFGDSCYNNTFGNVCYSNTFGNNCQYLKISDNTGTQKRYISVDSGVQGASSANQFDLYDPAILDKNYQVTFKRSAGNRYLMLWATDTGVMAGKVKDNYDADWYDIV